MDILVNGYMYPFVDATVLEGHIAPSANAVAVYIWDYCGRRFDPA